MVPHILKRFPVSV